MITEKDLQEAIAECEGTRNPNANTCMKLAAFYTIRDKMFAQDMPERPAYSSAGDPSQRMQASYESDTEFIQVARDVSLYSLMEVLDEIMTALSVLNPRLYNAAIRKLVEKK